MSEVRVRTSVDAASGVGEIELVRLTFDPPMFGDVGAALRAMDADVRVRAVVLHSSARMFTAGLDLKAASTLLFGDSGAGDEAEGVQRAVALRHGVRQLQEHFSAAAVGRKPVVAAVHGACIGAGVDLATACDIRLCTADATFAVTETKVAIVADLGTLQRLSRVVGPGVAREMAFTAEPLPADRALACGLVNAVYPTRDAMLAAARAMAARIAAHSPLVVQGVKQVLRYSEEHSVADGLEYVALWNAAMLQSSDLMEAVTAFLSKRPPTFKNHL